MMQYVAVTQLFIKVNDCNGKSQNGHHGRAITETRAASFLREGGLFSVHLPANQDIAW